MKNVSELTGRDLEVYQSKLRIMHHGPCSSLRNTCGEEPCPCNLNCPLHGRCCDCIEHHIEHISRPDINLTNYGWAPRCIQMLVSSRFAKEGSNSNEKA